MVKVKVCAVFDDGSNLVKRTHFLLPQDGTIGDAVNCFQKYHAQTLWAATDGVDLVGILAEKDLRLPYGEAFPSLTHPDFKLEDMMEPNDFLVLRSAAGTGGASEPVPSSAAGRARDEGEVESGKTKRDEAKDKEAKPKAVISEEVRSAHPGGSEHTPAPDGEVESGEAVARMPTRDEKVKTGGDSSSVSRWTASGRNKAATATVPARGGEGENGETRGDATSVDEEVRPETAKPNKPKPARHHVGFAAAWHQLADYNKPPRLKKQQRVTRSRQKRSLFPGVLNETSEKRPRKKAKVQQKVKAEAKPPATENSPTDYQYSDMDSSTHGIGSRYFYLCDDGSEYPVRILDPAENKNFSVKSNERIVVFEGYRKKFKTTVSELLPATDKRKARFQKEKRLKKEKQAHEKKRAKRAKALYGRITSRKGPFPQCNEPGTLFLQATRRVYFTKNNDTPVSISKKFGVPAGKIVYDNRLQHPTLQETSRLHPLTCIILPLEESDVSAAQDPATSTNDGSRQSANKARASRVRDKETCRFSSAVEDNVGLVSAIEEPSTKRSGEAVAKQSDESAPNQAKDSSKEIDNKADILTSGKSDITTTLEPRGGSTIKKEEPSADATADNDEWCRETVEGNDNEPPFVIFSKKSKE